MSNSVTVLDNAISTSPGLRRIGAGFIRTVRGRFAFGPATPEELRSVFTTEDGLTEYDDELLNCTELGDSVRRVLGVDLPMTDPIRLSRFTLKDRQAQRYRGGRKSRRGMVGRIGCPTAVQRITGIGVLAAWCGGTAPA
ncbi:hypothetical protein [Nocardia sp. NPDC051463]|uniref:hypothetical protein n=1 Tax=Nocardia sp. NPDC051463 TaxID=3154845 RepID=UPI00344C0628